MLVGLKDILKICIQGCSDQQRYENKEACLVEEKSEHSQKNSKHSNRRDNELHIEIQGHRDKESDRRADHEHNKTNMYSEKFISEKAVNQ